MHLTVALEGDVVHDPGGEHVVIGIEGLNGDGHRFLIGVEERYCVYFNRGTYSRRRVVGLREASVSCGESRGGVEALTTLGKSRSNLRSTGWTTIGGDNLEPRTDTVEGDIQV